MRVASLLVRAPAVGLALAMATGCVAGTRQETPEDEGSHETAEAALTDAEKEWNQLPART